MTNPVVKFKSFSSGSAGNCYFLGVFDGRVPIDGIVIDAGVSLRRFRREMTAEGLGMDSFSDILVTHDHMDHIRSLGSFCKYLLKPVWATPTLHYALAHHTYTLDHIAAVRHELKEGEWNVLGKGNIRARYFVVPHDATQTVGYHIEAGNVKFTIMTDIGAMTPEALEYASQSDVVVIESNYDEDMLLHGPYPKELQDRIRGGNGHLSNDCCAAAIEKFYHSGLRRIFLCHLSENNNTPNKALEISRAVLSRIDKDGETTLQALPRLSPSPLYIIG